MNFLTACHTDRGTKKTINEDSFFIAQARVREKNLLFAAVCDGMGGLSKGEVASASMIKRLSDWFSEILPDLVLDGFVPEMLTLSLEKLISEANDRIYLYGEQNGFTLGTTCVTFLCCGEHYYIMNIGDSRVYLLSDGMFQITRDQTWCQMEVEKGRMTQEEAADHPRRNILLQCIGAGEKVEPEYYIGDLQNNQCFLICSDGFRHKALPAELYERLQPSASVTAEDMKNNLVFLTELEKERGEKDNITALLIKTM